MSEKALKLKKGGLDTIIAYIVVMLPLLYVLVYIIATIYHFSVQMYMNQVVKEATVMASTYGEVTTGHADYIEGKLKDILDKDEDGEDGNVCRIEYYVRPFDENRGVVGDVRGPYDTIPTVKKADIIGIYVTSIEPSILGSVSSFSLFGSSSNTNKLYYTSYREEIIRNDPPS